MFIIIGMFVIGVGILIAEQEQVKRSLTVSDLEKMTRDISKK